MWLFNLLFYSLSTLICRGTDISKCFSESLGIRDNESRLYLKYQTNLTRLLQSTLLCIQSPASTDGSFCIPVASQMCTYIRTCSALASFNSAKSSNLTHLMISFNDYMDWSLEDMRQRFPFVARASSDVIPSERCGAALPWRMIGPAEKSSVLFLRTVGRNAFWI